MWRIEPIRLANGCWWPAQARNGLTYWPGLYGGPVRQLARCGHMTPIEADGFNHFSMTDRFECYSITERWWPVGWSIIAVVKWVFICQTRAILAETSLRFQMCRNCQRYNVEGIPQNELTQLQHPWYLSDFTIYSNMSTQFDANKHCVPNMVKLVTWHGRSLYYCSLTVVYSGHWWCKSEYAIVLFTRVHSASALLWAVINNSLNSMISIISV
jgi:hypothetical protein